MPQRANPELVRNMMPYFPVRGEVLPVIDVTSLQIGAKGDGTTDDTAAIQLALTACSTLGGGIVYLPPYRTYIIGSAGDTTNDGIHIYTNTILLGGGWSTILKMQGSTNLGQIIYGTGSGMTISNLAIDGNDANNTSGDQRGIRLVNATNALIERVYVHDVYGSAGDNAGIRIEGSSDYDSHSRIVGALVAGNTGYGITISQARHVEITDCRVTGNGFSGIYVTTTTGPFIISNNNVSLNGFHGILLNSAGTRYNGGIVIGNLVKGNSVGSSDTYSGIRLITCVSVNVGNNVCIDDGAGSPTQHYGIEETGTSSYNSYVGNTLDGNVTGAISESGANNKTAHNIGSAAHDS